MTDILRDQVLRVLAAHVGEWIGNGRPDAHCQCGYRGRLGELHSVHVADAVIAALSSVEPDHREEAEDDDVNGFWEWDYLCGSISVSDDGCVMWGPTHFYDVDQLEHAAQVLLSAVAKARSVADNIRHTYPGVQSIGGVRADRLPDHPSGHALDIMIGSNLGLGDSIAADVRSQSGRFGVKYVLWKVPQHWNHVHVTVL